MRYRFGDFTLDTEILELRHDGNEVIVEPQVFSLLAYLIEQRARVVSKDDLLETVWGGRIVSDATLNARINMARRAVHDTGKAQAVIRTFARRGFRFVAAIDETAGNVPPPLARPPIAVAEELKPSIVVLPFKNVGGKAEQDYFAAGITEDILTALSRVRWLFVISRNSAFNYQPETVDLPRLSDELCVRYILQGSVRADENHVRINALLIDGATNRSVWAERYDGELREIFDLQDQIASRIVSSLVPEISLAEVQRTRRKHAESLDSWDHYLRALYLMHQLDPKVNESAKNEFQLSIAIDTNFAAAHAGLAWCLILEGIVGWGGQGRKAMDSALRHAQIAVNLDEDDPRASCALAAVYALSSHQKRAERAARRAIELDPNMTEAHGILGYALGFQGRADEAIKSLERALQGSPRDHMRWLWYQGIANAHFAAARYADAFSWARKAAELRANWFFGYAIAAASAILLGRKDDAAAAMNRILDLYPRYDIHRVQRNPMWSDPAIRERFCQALMAAGIPH